jgi:hypothetical protein
VALATSTTRPATNGPRETTRQVAVAPAGVLRYNVAPMGAALSAQVPVGMVFNQVAIPYCTSSDVVVVTLGGGLATVWGGEGVLTTPRLVTATAGTDWPTGLMSEANSKEAVGGPVVTVGWVLLTGSAETGAGSVDTAPSRPSARLDRAKNRRVAPLLAVLPAAALAMTNPFEGRWSRVRTGTTAKLPQRAKMVTLRRLFDRECLRRSVSPFPRAAGKWAKTIY